jgi:hypothetical protein
MTSLNICTIELAGFSLTGAVDDKGSYYIAVPDIERALGERADSTRQKLGSKSLKAALGKTIPLGKKRAGESFMNFMAVADFTLYLGWMATEKGSHNAQALLMATLKEALERRIDAALGIDKKEEDYEKATKEFYRELARKDFQPELCSWNQSDIQAGKGNKRYDMWVNEFKRNLSLPVYSIDAYTAEEIRRWSKGITTYNALRSTELSHKETLVKVRQIMADID